MISIITATGYQTPISPEINLHKETSHNVECVINNDGNNPMMEIICIDCNDVLEKKIISETGHIVGDWEITKKKTCINNGEKVQRCLICHEIINKEVISASHNYNGIFCVDCKKVENINEENRTIMFTRTIAAENNIDLTGDVVIPEKVIVNGIEYTVSGIYDYMFSGSKTLTSITLPNTIRYIGVLAFNNCSALESINLNDGLLYIDKGAFQLCTKLTDIKIPDSVMYIGDFAFNHCSSINIETLKLPNSLVQLGKYYRYNAHMFYDFGTSIFSEFIIDDKNQFYKTDDGILYTRDGKTLVSIPRGKMFDNNTFIMPDSVTNLCELSFSRNTNINTLVLSDNLIVDEFVTTEEKEIYLNIGNDLSIACYGYSNVQKYETKESNNNYKSYNGILYSKDMTELIAIPNHYNGIIDIPEGVEKWNSEAIWNMIEYFKDKAFNKITKIIIPSSMIEIPKEQMDTINLLAKTYGTKIEVSSLNPVFYIYKNQLIKK